MGLGRVGAASWLVRGDMLMQWFAIHTRAQKEELAARELRRVGFEVFWPHTTRWVNAGHKDKSRLLKRSWLSRYFFVRSFQENLWAINQSPGVATVVRAPGGDPFPIPTRIIDTIIAQANDNGEIFVTKGSRKRSNFKPGQIVRLLDEKSPLFGLYVEVEKVLDNGNICGILREQIAGTQKTILQAPVVGEVVGRSA